MARAPEGSDVESRDTVSIQEALAQLAAQIEMATLLSRQYPLTYSWARAFAEVTKDTREPS